MILYFVIYLVFLNILVLENIDSYFYQCMGIVNIYSQSIDYYTIKHCLLHRLMTDIKQIIAQLRELKHRALICICICISFLL